MGSASSVTGKACRDWTTEEVAGEIDGLGKGYSAFAEQVRNEGFDGETLLDEDLTFDDLLDGVDEGERKKPRLKKLQKALEKVRSPATDQNHEDTQTGEVSKAASATNATEVHSPMKEDGEDWDTLTEMATRTGEWAEANALAQKQIQRGQIFPCSRQECGKYHGNYQPECDYRGYCCAACKGQWDGAAFEVARNFLGDIGLGAKIDLQTQNADWWATSKRGKDALLQPNVRALVMQELNQQKAVTVSTYERLSKEVDQEGLEQVKSVSSAMDGKSCGTFDVDNPKQRISSENQHVPEIDMYIHGRKNAPRLVDLVKELVKSVEGDDSPLLTQIAWNLKRPTSFYRKAENGDPTTICDVLRASGPFSTAAKLKQGFELLREKERAGEIKIRTVENYFKDPIGGYMDMCTQIEFTDSEAAGFVCELQLQLPEMLKFKKEVGHKIYEWTRRFDSWEKAEAKLKQKENESRMDHAIRVLRDSGASASAQEQAAMALGGWAYNDDNRVAIAKAGGIGPLVGLLTRGGAGAQERAAQALRNLAVNNDDNRVAIAKAGGVGPLVGLLTSGSAGAQKHAAVALERLAENSELKAAIEKAKAGGPAL